MTTADGYLRLALFKFPQAYRTPKLFDAEKRNHLKRIVNFVVSVYAPMFLKVYIKQRVSDGPENAMFLGDLPLFFNEQDQTLVCEAIKECFRKHATWLNPANVAVSIFCEYLPFLLSAVLARSYLCPPRFTLTKCCGYRSHLRSFFSGKSKYARCNIVTRDFGGLSTITVVLANVSMVNRQLSWREESVQQHRYHQ